MVKKIVVLGLTLGVIVVAGIEGYHITQNHESLIHSVAMNPDNGKLNYVDCKSDIAYVPEYYCHKNSATS